MSSMQICWLIVTVFMLVTEAVTTQLVSLWFAAGGLVTFGVSLLTDALWIQIPVFVLVSIGVLLAFRPVLKGKLTPRECKTNADRVMGTVGVVSEAVDNVACRGQVMLQGQQWTARSEDGAPIEKGKSVLALRVEGVKLIVREIPDAEETETRIK